jgi:hypothetical protein
MRGFSGSTRAPAGASRNCCNKQQAIRNCNGNIDRLFPLFRGRIAARTLSLSLSLSLSLLLVAGLPASPLTRARPRPRPRYDISPLHRCFAPLRMSGSRHLGPEDVNSSQMR